MLKFLAHLSIALGISLITEATGSGKCTVSKLKLVLKSKKYKDSVKVKFVKFGIVVPRINTM